MRETAGAITAPEEACRAKRGRRVTSMGRPTARAGGGEKKGPRPGEGEFLVDEPREMVDRKASAKNAPSRFGEGRKKKRSSADPDGRQETRRGGTQPAEFVNQRRLKKTSSEARGRPTPKKGGEARVTGQGKAKKLTG